MRTCARDAPSDDANVTALITSDDVRAAYDGFEGRLYELMMGELLHIGGLESSLELVERAGIAEGFRGVDRAYVFCWFSHIFLMPGHRST